MRRMPDPAPGRIQNVSDTALWVAAYRAEESERPDALFKDPYARKLTGPRGFEILDSMPKGRKYSWPMVVRTVLLDRMIEECIGKGADLVLNLAAGLDSRPYRMALPVDLLWVEVDLPAMTDYKAGVLAAETPGCRLERIKADLSDDATRRSVLADVARRGRNVLVLTEGLLIYLEERNVASLADELHAAGTYRWWATDLASPGLIKMMSRSWGRQVVEAGAPFRFAPAKGPDYFADHGWRRVEVRNSFYTAAKLRRLPPVFAFMARVFPEPKTWKPKRVWGGVCLFERA
jgi:methyltransferase (TIGR00027 family)